MMCDAPHGAQFVLGAVGTLPQRSHFSIPFAVANPVVDRAFVPHARPSVPDAPPPRLL